MPRIGGPYRPWSSFGSVSKRQRRPSRIALWRTFARRRCPDVGATVVAVPEVSRSDLIRWSEALSGIARTGLGFSQALYERERYEEVLAVAADMRHAAGHDLVPTELTMEWMRIVGSGVPGYVTPKVAVGAVVGNDAGELLLIQRSDSGLYPTGWADIGYSPAEVAAKEVREETGILCEPLRVLGVIDGMRAGFTTVPLYSIVFVCRQVGGELNPHPLECRDAGWFREDALPSPMGSSEHWIAHAFAAIRGEVHHATFDAVRDPVWRGEHPV
jgi:ADP-ribose pyrophosphatase YjhB (NUDIX family)